MHAIFRSAVTLMLLSMLVLAAAGCTGPAMATERTPIATMYHPTSSDRPMTFDVAGPIEIDVESFGGDVFITCDPRDPEGRVQVIRRSVHGARRYREGRHALEEIDYTAEIVPGELGQRLQIRTTTAHTEPHFQRADVHIFVPEVDGVHVRTRNGRVYARGVQGKVDIVTNNGDVRVMTNQRMNKPVTILNDSGNIDLRVRGESSGFIDAEAIGGRVVHRMRYGRCVIQPGTKADRLYARFNDGQNPIVLRTVHGNIRIASVSNPERVGQFILD